MLQLGESSYGTLISNKLSLTVLSVPKRTNSSSRSLSVIFGSIPPTYSLDPILPKYRKPWLGPLSFAKGDASVRLAASTI